ncbi:hypothetical protein Pyn_31332 [Prunus yedoensis var. nudiflora]|uniref:Uncharacterized protein n=1 Tax=Prunus yedoensis var. nudiflora TaxID=2094558 RepID=A0A314YS98_PRUYE|nr:hypothetical protein Pyn_31332 [Prunus yedoensis var. nudiflora]
MLRYVIRCRVGNIASLNDLRRKKAVWNRNKETDHPLVSANKPRPGTEKQGKTNNLPPMCNVIRDQEDKTMEQNGTHQELPNNNLHMFTQNGTLPPVRCGEGEGAYVRVKLQMACSGRKDFQNFTLNNACPISNTNPIMGPKRDQILPKG